MWAGFQIDALSSFHVWVPALSRNRINLKSYLSQRKIETYHLINGCIKNRHYFDTWFEFRYSDRMNFLTLQIISNSSLKLPSKFILNSQKIKNLSKEGQLIRNVDPLKWRVHHEVMQGQMCLPIELLRVFVFQILLRILLNLLPKIFINNPTRIIRIRMTWLTSVAFCIFNRYGYSHGLTSWA